MEIALSLLNATIFSLGGTRNKPISSMIEIWQFTTFRVMGLWEYVVQLNHFSQLNKNQRKQIGPT